MPLRQLDEELVREAPRREIPELRSRRAKHVRTDEVLEREDARGEPVVAECAHPTISVSRERQPRNLRIRPGMRRRIPHP